MPAASRTLRSLRLISADGSLDRAPTADIGTRASSASFFVVQPSSFRAAVIWSAVITIPSAYPGLLPDQMANHDLRMKVVRTCSIVATHVSGRCPYLIGEETTMLQLHRFAKDQSGATAIEYGLIAGLISVVILTALTTIGSKINVKFTNIASRLN